MTETIVNTRFIKLGDTAFKELIGERILEMLKTADSVKVKDVTPDDGDAIWLEIETDGV